MQCNVMYAAGMYL